MMWCLMTGKHVCVRLQQSMCTELRTQTIEQNSISRKARGMPGEGGLLTLSVGVSGMNLVGVRAAVTRAG